MLMNWISAVVANYLGVNSVTCNLQATVPEKLVYFLTKLRLICVGYDAVG
jgi:hypothetical protein